MARDSVSLQQLWLAFIIATLPGMAESFERPLPYPSTWPARVSSACTAIVGHYRNQPIAVEDAGQRAQSLRLSELLGVPRSTGTPMTERSDDAETSTSAARHAEATLARARGRVSISMNPEGRLLVAVNDAKATASSSAHCLTGGKRGPTVRVDSHRLQVGMPADAPLSHLARIGIRQVRTELISTAGGDLVIRLIVTQRFGREESFGFPAMKQYWLRFARIEASAG